MDREADRRDAPRVSLGTLAVYSLPRADGHYNLLGSGQAKDLSISGAGLRTREALPAGAEIDLRFQLSGNVRAARARVVWARELEPERSYEAGVRFLSVGLSLVADIFARVRENHGTRTRFEGRGLLELVGLIGQESLSGLVAV